MLIPARILILFLLLTISHAVVSQTGKRTKPQDIKKVRDVVISRDTAFHAAFPSVIRREGGEILVAFRRAPNRRIFGEAHTNHVDPNSYLVKVTSADGIRWTDPPELIYAHPFGGSQDPCLLQLRDGTILCTSYGWAFLRPEKGVPPKGPVLRVSDNAAFLGGYLLRSGDGGNGWEGPFYPPHISDELYNSPYGQPLPAYNRGALTEGRDGRLFWVVAAHDDSTSSRTSVHLIVSRDKGLTWEYSTTVAAHDSASFNEASVYETVGGDLVAFLRTEGLKDQACIARSVDGGKSFGAWEKMGFQGHPLHALRLPDDRVLLTYGYRHKPYGIRARVLNPECTDFATAPEIILRSDGGSTDLGYPWSVMLDDRHVLVTYYFNARGTDQHIAGTLLELK